MGVSLGLDIEVDWVYVNLLCDCRSNVEIDRFGCLRSGRGRRYLSGFWIL